MVLDWFDGPGKPEPRSKKDAGPAPEDAARGDMIVTTTPSVEGRRITDYKGIVVGEAVVGVNVISDMLSAVTDFVGGRSGSYESELQHARKTALREMEERAAAAGANAVVGVDLDYEVVGGSMLMVSASGTAVVLS